MPNMKWWGLTLGLAAASLGSLSCTLDNPEAPALSGPSELAMSINLRANPDTIIADGFSSSVIEAEVRDENGQTASGRQLHFEIIAPPGSATTLPTGVFLDFGNIAPLNGPRPIAGGAEATLVSATTDSSGIARIRYWAPFRTDLSNDATVTIGAREAGTNVRGDILRSVDLFLRAADRPQFPSGSCDGADSGISVEPQQPTYGVNQIIFFTATDTGSQTDPIGRYEWDFGDASARREGRSVEHRFGAEGDYTVTLFTTLAISGTQSSCTRDIAVAN